MKMLARTVEAVQFNPEEISAEHIEILSDVTKVLGYRPKKSDCDIQLPYTKPSAICRNLGSVSLNSFAKNGSLRRYLIAKSYCRSDKHSPPICLLCLNSDREQTKFLGALRWSPQFPLFFAFHELCVTSAPLTVEIDDCADRIELLTFGMKIQSVLKELKRIKSQPTFLNCNFCHMGGALQGCYYKKTMKMHKYEPDETFRCPHTYHLPCALRSGACVSYEGGNEFLVCSAREVPSHSSFLLEKQNEVIALLSKYLSRSNRKKFLDAVNGGSNMPRSCGLCSDDVDFNPAVASLGKVVIIACCGGVHVYHHTCMQNHQLADPFRECRCPQCDEPNSVTHFPAQLKLQGIFAQYISHDDGDRKKFDAPYQTKCTNKKCANPDGPYHYDLSKLNTDLDNVMAPWEPLNDCERCSRTCHRKCAGGIWAMSLAVSVDDEEDDVEPLWVCDPCTAKLSEERKSKRASIGHSMTTAIDQKPTIMDKSDSSQTSSVKQSPLPALPMNRDCITSVKKRKSDSDVVDTTTSKGKENKRSKRVSVNGPARLTEQHGQEGSRSNSPPCVLSPMANESSPVCDEVTGFVNASPHSLSSSGCGGGGHDAVLMPQQICPVTKTECDIEPVRERHSTTHSNCGGSLSSAEDFSDLFRNDNDSSETAVYPKPEVDVVPRSNSEADQHEPLPYDPLLDMRAFEAAANRMYELRLQILRKISDDKREEVIDIMNDIMMIPETGDLE